MNKQVAWLTNLSSADIALPEDRSLGRLLDLDGEIMEMGGGYWVKLEARKVPPTAERPHGIDYSLCLFSPDDERLICYDNAHPVSVGSGPARRKSPTHDHTHKGRKVQPYSYANAEGLMDAFWTDVYETLKVAGVR